MLSYILHEQITLTKVIYFSQLYYWPKLYDPILSGVNVTHTLSHMVAMLIYITKGINIKTKA